MTAPCTCTLEDPVSRDGVCLICRGDTTLRDKPWLTDERKESIMKRVVVQGGCWGWMGSICQTHGYATYGKKRGHRLVYEILVRPIPDGMQLDHLCRNRACVNPDHLEVVTSRENTLRGTGPSAACARKTECKLGHPFDAENTIHNKDGSRDCRICKNRRDRERKRRARALLREGGREDHDGTSPAASPVAPLAEWRGVYPGMCADPEICRGWTHCPRNYSCCE